MDTPLYNALLSFAKKNKAPFYMPGHKGRNPLPAACDLFALDVTELPETDSLFCPEGIIREAEHKAAEAFGAEHTFFMVNGSSGGLLAAMKYALGDGDRVAVDRCCHHSVTTGLIVTGADPVFLSPAYLPNAGIPGGIPPALLEETLIQFPDTKAVVLTSPNYYGVCSDVAAIADVAHRHGCLLLVDEAHGAHFCFGRCTPPSALSCGADIVVQSMHKTLPAPNPSALVHCRGSVDAERLKQCVNMFQTTSPSYPIMAHMDAARWLAQTYGAQWTDRLCRQIAALHTYTIPIQPGRDAVAGYDPFKLLVSDRSRTGTQLYGALRGRGIYPELCDRNNVLLMCSWSTTDADLRALHAALDELDIQPREHVRLSAPPVEGYNVPVRRPRDVFEMSSAPVRLEDSVGRVARYNVTAFPPCIPIMLCGERITNAQMRYVRTLLDDGQAVQGVHNGFVEVVPGI